MSIHSLWDNYLRSGASKTDNERLLKFINSFSLVGISSLLIFGMLHLREGNSVVGTWELLFGAIGIANIVILRSTKKTSFASSTILIVMLGVLALLLVSGGLHNTGLFWFFTFPALAFFMKGYRRGVWWMLAAFFEIIIAIVFPSHTPFTVETLRQLMAALFAVTLLVYFYQVIHEEEDMLLRKRTKELLNFGWKEKADED